MNLSHALSTALSGLTASTRLADVAASNVANALTEGYGRREVVLSSRLIGSDGSGVSVRSIHRAAQPHLQGELRFSTAAQSHAQTRLDFVSSFEKAIGNSDEPGSLLSLATAFEARLNEAAAQPDSQTRLVSVLHAAQKLSGKLASAAEVVLDHRQDANRQIDSAVRILDTSLTGVATLNSQIVAQRASGGDICALLDQRQLLIDRIAEIIPVREIPQDRDQISLVSVGGLVLLDSKPAKLSFLATGTITADLSVATGSLSTISANGRPLSPASINSLIGGGRLSALFDIRDNLAPKFHDRLDGLATDLITRFSDPLVDPTISPPMPGIFTDAGGAIAPGGSVGLASRLRVNPLVDPDAGGEVWRLRDGVGALVPGSGGDGRLLASLGQTAASKHLPGYGGFTIADSTHGLSTQILSAASVARLGLASDVAFAAASANSFRQDLLQNGVDTDQEMQDLLKIEKAYAANARVLQTIDSMFDALLGIR